MAGDRFWLARVAVPCPECDAEVGQPCTIIAPKAVVQCRRDVEAYGDRCLSHRSANSCALWARVGESMDPRVHNGRLAALWAWQEAGHAAMRRAQLAQWFRDHGHILQEAKHGA